MAVAALEKASKPEATSSGCKFSKPSKSLFLKARAKRPASGIIWIHCSASLGCLATLLKSSRVMTPSACWTGETPSSRRASSSFAGTSTPASLHRSKALATSSSSYAFKSDGCGNKKKLYSVRCSESQGQGDLQARAGSRCFLVLR